MMVEEGFVLHGKEKVETLRLCVACRALLTGVWSFDTSSARDGSTIS